MNITSKTQLINALTTLMTRDASNELEALTGEATKRYGDLTDENFHKHRDFLRLNWSGAAGVLSDEQWEAIAGGKEGHFMHLSKDGDRVCFTKDDDKGRADIQTVVTTGRYEELFGVTDADIPHPDLVQTKFAKTESNHSDIKGLDGGPVNAKDTVRSHDDAADAMSSILKAALEYAGNEQASRDDQMLLNMSIADSVNKALSILLKLAKKGA